MFQEFSPHKKTEASNFGLYNTDSVSVVVKMKIQHQIAKQHF